MSIIFSSSTSVYWTRWFAWRPVKVHGRRRWLTMVYRREIPFTYATMDDWRQYEYGTIFDVLAHPIQEEKI